MNTGLQDAHNLGWKLTLAARDLAASGLLESYSAERRPVGLDVVENTSRALNDVIAQKINLPGIKETQLLIGYRNSEIVADERSGIDPALPSAGDRAVDVDELRRPFVAHTLRLRNLIGDGKHVLLGYIGSDPKELGGLRICSTCSKLRRGITRQDLPSRRRARRFRSRSGFPS